MANGHNRICYSAGKVYLSPVIDCFDGMVVKWNIRTTPDSILVNKMLEDAIGTLLLNEHPLVHTDRGCHYRWTGWIERMQAAGNTFYVKRMFTDMQLAG